MNTSTIIHIPHASTKIPKKFRKFFCEEKLHNEIDFMTDWFCEELFDLGRERIVFPFSRLVCDVERFRDDREERMSKIGMGAVYKNASDLTPLRSVSRTQKNKILEMYYDKHHSNFTSLVEKCLEANNKCLIIDAHSFYPTSLPYEYCKNSNRPDFCIGTSDFHTPGCVFWTLKKFLNDKGFSVKQNFPFEGTIVPMKFYNKDFRVKSVMIEVNRRLYLNSPGNRNDRFYEIKGILEKCVGEIEKILDII